MSGVLHAGVGEVAQAVHIFLRKKRQFSLAGAISRSSIILLQSLNSLNSATRMHDSRPGAQSLPGLDCRSHVPPHLSADHAPPNTPRYAIHSAPHQISTPTRLAAVSACAVVDRWPVVAPAGGAARGHQSGSIALRIGAGPASRPLPLVGTKANQWPVTRAPSPAPHNQVPLSPPAQSDRIGAGAAAPICLLRMMDSQNGPRALNARAAEHNFASCVANV